MYEFVYHELILTASDIEKKSHLEIERFQYSLDVGLTQYGKHNTFEAKCGLKA